MHLAWFDCGYTRLWTNFSIFYVAANSNPEAFGLHSFCVRGVSWSEVATVPKRKSHRGLDLNLSLNTEVNIWKGWKENGGTK